MNILKRLLAILLGITLLPLRILAYNALYAMTALFLGIAAVIGLPILFASFINNKGISKTMNFLLTTLIVFPVVVATSATALAGIVTFLMVNAAINMLKYFSLGFKNGLLYGMDGFWTTLDSQSTLPDDLNLQIRAVEAGVNTDELIDDVDFDGFQQIRGELQDVVVVREDLEVPNLESKAPKVAAHALLNYIQLEKIKKLIEELTCSTEPLSPRVKRQLEDLKTLYTQYNDLWTKLEAVRTALVANNKTQIKDEMIAYNEVETPILLVKQYENEGKWLNVPANSYVTDKESLEHWLKQNPKHPLNKDLLKKPQLYNGMKTHYIWYELTKEDCSSQELEEASARMSTLANALFPVLSPSQKINLGLGSAPQTFFSIKTGNPESLTTPLDNTLAPVQLT